MANDEYSDFFQYFHETLNPKDQLPVRISSYKLCKEEVVGAIFNWTTQYLRDKKCPWHLISFLWRIVLEETRKRCKKAPIQCGFSPSDNAYAPLKLMHTVIEVVNEVCFNYKSSLNVQNTQNMAVPYPLPAPEDVYSVVSTWALKNYRRKMEDRLIVVRDLNTIFTKQDTTPSHYYAVFDGHGGEHAAAYSANHLHQYLAESTNFTTDPEQAIRDAFSKTDSMFIKKCETEKINSGTTAVCALLLPKEKTLYVAWVGDSQAVLVSLNKIRSCVEPHTPGREDERQRIVNEGGTVLHWGVWRVNGKLSVSRAIGDADYKPYVTATPDIVKIPLGEDEDFFILGSDGLWDHLSKLKMANYVYEALNQTPARAHTISRDLVELAKSYGSSDNISVIVVFLRDPREIVERSSWNYRLKNMDTLDNANNPFAIPNKTNNVDRITEHADDDLLLNFADELKKKEDIPNNDLIKMLEKSNCGRLTPDFDKDNLGPETNVDVQDDAPPSPNFDQTKRQSEALDNNQNCSNPFNDIEKSLELNLNLKAGTFEGLTSPTVEECVPPANSVHNVSQLIDAGAESDSEEDEEEWNYVRGEEANKENANPLQLSSQVAEEEEEDIDNAMSQLNPNAAEFIPSPARAVASPLGRLLDEDQVISRSPKKPPPTEVDINVPNQREFEKDISLKPHEIEEAFSNGHQDAFNNETNAINALNSRLDEFHFGPNAAPFTPAKLLDQSETSSTRANYGDESELGVSFNDSMLSQDQNDFVQKDDPMSMSFHQDRSDDSNLFDLNKVHILPENVDEFIAKEDKSNSLFDDTISDLTEHFPLGKPEEESKQEETEFTTDLDNEDKNMEELKTNISSTPIEDRSQSPSDNQTSVDDDDDRRLSSREEIRTPVEEDSQASPVEECKILKVEHLEIQDGEEIRSKSPNEQNRLCSPFEDEHLISPVEEHKSPSPYEEKEMYSTQEEKDVCSPFEENDVCCLISKQNEPRNDDKEVLEEKDLLSEKDIIQEEKYMEEKQLLEDEESVPEKEVTEEKVVLEPQAEHFSYVEAIASPDSIRDIVSPVQERQLYSPEGEVDDSLAHDKEVSPSDSEMDTAPIAEETASFVQERIVTPEVASPVQEEVTAHVALESYITSPTQEQENVNSPQDITSVEEKYIPFSPQEECSLVRETVESPSLEQEVSTAEIDEDNVANIVPSASLDELATEPIEVTTTCDNLEIPQQEPVPIESEPSQKDEEFLEVETEKSDEVKAKENVENLLQLDNLSTVPVLEEKCLSSTLPISNEGESLNNDSLLEINDESGVQLDQSEDNSKAELPSFTSAEQSMVPSCLDVDTTNVGFHLQETLEADENLVDVSNIQCSLNKSAADTSSINTASFLERSLFEEVKCPISPNLSVNEPTVMSCETSLVQTEKSIDISQLSPARDQQPDLSKVTSTPVADKLEVALPLSTEAKSPAVDKTAKAKEADKKPATKTKVTSSTTAKKVPPTKTTLAPTKTTLAPTKTTTKPSPKPAAKPISKTNTIASKVNSTSKTESTVSKVANKSSTSTTSKANITTARIPLSSRTTSTTNKTNGTAKPATKLPAGTIKKSTDGSSVKSTTSTGQSKMTSTTARSTLASARSATNTAAPKQRPNTLKSAVTKTVDAPKPATARTTTAPRVPLTSRTTASRTSSSLVNKDVKDSAGRTISKPRSATEKQVKETANKLTAASRAVSKTTSTIQSLAKTTTVTKKSEVTASRTATSRTTMTSKAPIKKPSETTKTATTKVGKPKLNGVAPVVNEKIIVNNASKELNSVNSNGDQQFVKDNSPIDNKLITDQLSEPTAN